MRLSVWVTADGGYSWGRCIQDAEWDDRYLQMMAVGSDGALYVGGGVQFDVGRFAVFQDMWRSTISFHDLPAVAKACGITIPDCGTGLRCWPGADTVKATDGSYVSCTACPHASASSSGASTAVVAVMVVFIALSAVLAAGCVYLWNKVKSAAGQEPLWGAKSTSDSTVDTTALYHQQEGL